MHDSQSLCLTRAISRALKSPLSHVTIRGSLSPSIARAVTWDFGAFCASRDERTLSAVERRCVPNGRRPCALLDSGRHVWRKWQFVPYGKQCAPPECWNLQHPNVIHRRLYRIEIGVPPESGQHRRSYAVAIRAGCEVHRISHRGREVRHRIDRTISRYCDIEDLLLGMLAIEGDLDHLDAVEIGSRGILRRLDEEGRCHISLGGFGRQISAHRYPLGVCIGDPRTIAQHPGFEIPAPKHSQPDPCTGGGKRLLALECRKDRVAGVLLGPYPGQA